MTLKQMIKNQLSSQEIAEVKKLKEENELRYAVAYKLDLSIFEDHNEKGTHLLCWDELELVGYAALSHYDPEEVEVTMIAKDDKQIFQMMDEAWSNYSKQQKAKRILVIADREESGVTQYLKENENYTYSFSEYSMILARKKFVAESSEVALELAKIEDAKPIAALEDHEHVEEVIPLNLEDLKKTLVLRKDGEVIACIRIENDRQSYGIYGFVVRSDFRGQGIGRKILNQVLQQLVEKNATSIYLEVESTNTPAYKLYESIGFEKKTLFDYYLYELN
ncbi:GNAT family N-acetyltransferase [Candidatus Enterococcus mansonii]|uniref:N-acetyltransferase domain-containing protein n=1 Tax=Candidatus Enterococcus mansonii TaxID=1834181 RepID=A0A242CKU4_9ENTE|nr:GNAT family N-acetyltransferase [Enterococcus sp. 4G2_DIV0659]OTO10540.1 hypothetical protein A5880_001224 [Enterococcus sp. 4G2_DIV0659]